MHRQHHARPLCTRMHADISHHHRPPPLKRPCSVLRAPCSVPLISGFRRGGLDPHEVPPLPRQKSARRLVIIPSTFAVTALNADH
jgi:hypothetical protein